MYSETRTNHICHGFLNISPSTRIDLVLSYKSETMKCDKGVFKKHKQGKVFLLGINKISKENPHVLNWVTLIKGINGE